MHGGKWYIEYGQKAPEAERAEDLRTGSASQIINEQQIDSPLADGRSAGPQFADGQQVDSPSVEDQLTTLQLAGEESDKIHELPPELVQQLPEGFFEWLRELQPPTAEQVSMALAAMALVGPAALGGMPVLPVTIDDQRRRQQEQIQQESESSVGVYQEAQEAETALVLSQRRLAAATKEVEGSTARVVSEQDVVRAAKKVVAGEVSPHKGRRFLSALTQVANDSVDLFILSTDERMQQEAEERAWEALKDEREEAEEDLEAWLREFE